MDTVVSILSQPFVWGLGLGLLIAGFGWKSAWTAKAALRTDIRRLTTEKARLQEHLNTHLTITADGQAQLQKELAQYKEQCENMRVSLAVLQQKPGRAEIRQWQILELAASRMREQAPGFAAAWERAIRTATEEMEASEGGLTKLIRKVLPTSSTPAGTAPQGPEKINLISEQSET
jgi:predicted  nucleic acid-binding Zn-ribbon protein